MQRKSGTREWAEVNKNIQQGCEHNCRYCYARHNALRFRQIGKPAEWEKMVLQPARLSEQPRYLGGKRIMFPTTHDTFPQFIDETITYLKGWLNQGNDMLIVSKPHMECIRKICDQLGDYKSQIVFRFTIGSMDDEVLKFWEPGAPCFQERLMSLKYAHNSGYTTSVSCEPFLDDKIVELVGSLLPYVTDTIWVGKMNHIRERVSSAGWGDKEFMYLQKVVDAQTDFEIAKIYYKLQNEPKVKWKDSIKKVMQLPEEEIG